MPSFAASFTYDRLGRRTGKTINSATTSFLYDGLNPTQEKNGATVTANLLTGLGIDELLTRTDGTGARGFLPNARAVKKRVLSWPGFDGHLKRRHDDGLQEVDDGATTTVYPRV